MSKVLVLDQSLRATGWAIVDHKNKKVITYGCIKTDRPKAKSPILKSEADIADGLKICEVLQKAIDEYKPSTVIFENPVGSRSARSGQALAFVKGLVIALTVTNNLKLDWVTAKEAKKALTNNRLAEKEEVFKQVSKEFPSFKKESKKLPAYVKYAVSDSLAVYLCWKEKG